MAIGAPVPALAMTRMAIAASLMDLGMGLAGLAVVVVGLALTGMPIAMSLVGLPMRLMASAVCSS